MGRKARPDLGKFLVSLPIALVDELDARAEKQGGTRSKLLTEALAQYLKRAGSKPPKRSKK
jgi:metal-responsive CopG/Arc/MetJ family transcriptional regulator